MQNKARKTELFNQIQILKQGKGHMCDSQPIQRKQGKLQKFIKASQMAIEKEGNEPIQYKYKSKPTQTIQGKLKLAEITLQ